MLQITRERLTLILIGLLPFHAFLVTVGTKIIAGPGHSPLPMLALWKEALLGVILMIAVLEAVKLKMDPSTRSGGQLTIDVLDICIVSLLLWSLLQPLILNSPFSIFHYAVGFKYDFLPLVVFLILRRVTWSPAFVRTAVAVLLGVGGIVAVYGIATLFFPISWFTALGYSDLHSLYIPGGPLAPFQQIEASGLRRIQSTFSGPNQLGLWLLIPLSLSLARLRKSFRSPAQWQDIAYLSFLGLVLLKTFSRAAWIGAAVILIIGLWKVLPRKQFKVASCGLLVSGSVILAMGIFFAPEVLLRVASSRGHIERPLEALRIMRDHPFGLGLGAAGPASNRFSDTCVDLPAGADASWAQPHPQLCVFVGGTQTQPLDRVCTCPLLPENWYLQIGVELGWIGFILYIFLVVTILRRSFLQLATCNQVSVASCKLQSTCALAFLGISIAALFLHAWEDSAVAYTVWVLMSAVLPVRLARI
ncbi:MAG: hypothetical protein Greene041662_721 [Candidatus Peregrinibacteria bacterium Greene0416_62]|nr:MAG: hypothetical protein Greene041662_721 [Candidatus Peregrinibacteria bacterium Greene0416_62]TSC98832.1 MAG: hypothetical protein Greene101449_826 [Candidatus Peregrinibacteria bacterium Greene1014_49]